MRSIIYCPYFSINVNMRSIIYCPFSSIDVNMRSIIYCNGIRWGTTADWEFALDQYQNTTSSSEQSSLRSALACTREMWLLQRYRCRCSCWVVLAGFSLFVVGLLWGGGVDGGGGSGECCCFVVGGDGFWCWCWCL